MKLFTKEIDQKLFDQYIMGSNLEDQMVVAKIFNPYGNGVWYLLNSDPSDPDYIWAIVDLFDVEMGSVSREELETLKVPPFRLGLERDLYFTPVNAKKLYESLLRGEKYEDGGTIDIKRDQNGDNWVFPNNPEGNNYGIKLAAGGMTAGRWYKDNSGQELRFIGESNGKLLFNDGQGVVYKDEDDFVQEPKEKKLFGFFEDGGDIKDDFLEDMAELHQEIAEITLVDGSKISGEELRSAHRKMEHGGEMEDGYGEDDDRWFLIENGFILKGKLRKKAAYALKSVLEKKNPQKEYSVIFIEDYESDDEYASGGFTSSFSGTPERRTRLTMAKGGGVGFTPYGETKGIYKIYYKADGKPQTEIWETKEMAVNSAKRYSSPQMEGEFTDIKVFDEDGSELDYMAEASYADGGEIEDSAKRLADNPNWTNEKLQAEYDSNSRDLRNFNNGFLKPSKVIGGGYKSSAVAKRLAKEWLENTVATYKKALEIRGVMAMGGRTKFKDKVQSIKASLLKRKKVSPKVQKDYGKTYSPKEAEESAKRIVGSMVKKEKRKPRVSKMLEKMKKGTQINKKKSTFKDRMKELSTKIKERKSKSTK